jgi:phage gp46-like protein
MTSFQTSKSVRLNEEEFSDSYFQQKQTKRQDDERLTERLVTLVYDVRVNGMYTWFGIDLAAGRLGSAYPRLGGRFGCRARL